MLAISGELDEHVERRALHTPLTEHLVNDGVREIVLDMSGLTMLALEGVAALMSLAYEARTHAKVLRVTGASGQPEQKLRITGMLEYLSDTLPNRSEDA